MCFFFSIWTIQGGCFSFLCVYNCRIGRSFLLRGYSVIGSLHKIISKWTSGLNLIYYASKTKQHRKHSNLPCIKDVCMLGVAKWQWNKSHKNKCYFTHRKPMALWRLMDRMERTKQWSHFFLPDLFRFALALPFSLFSFCFDIFCFTFLEHGALCVSVVYRWNESTKAYIRSRTQLKDNAKRFTPYTLPYTCVLSLIYTCMRQAVCVCVANFSWI